MKIQTKICSLLTVLIFLISKNGFNQTEIKVGLKVGISIPNLQSSGNNPVSHGWSSRLGPYTGIVGEIKLSKKLYLQAELNYSSQGGKKKGAQAIATNNFTSYFPPNTEVPPYVYANYSNVVKLNYLELPVMLKGEFELNTKISFFVNGGPYMAYLLNAKSVTGGSSNIFTDQQMTQPLLPAPASFDQSMNVKSDLNKFNLGIQGGLGLSLNFNNTNKLLITVGGNYGFVYIQKDDTNGKNNTGAATVSLGYLFKL